MANPPQAELSYTFAGKRDQKVPDCEIKGLLRSLKDRLIPSLSIILTPHLSTCLTQAQPLTRPQVLPLAKLLTYLLPHLLG
uniref:Uncharacterized protein n=1 Tax=candidate division WOR-3 bacterium TaxID=2052148 RepID=A0A7C6A8E7_UNCW3